MVIQYEANLCLGRRLLIEHLQEHDELPAAMPVEDQTMDLAETLSRRYIGFVGPFTVVHPLAYAGDLAW